ncbi:hypothetical protein C0584_05795 [Candidatus Parcubacteria bacterium]|nr:MAG: hypothetical protein C0584_05795 [Candidatus Parcubacteria bacterium]
MQKKLFSIKEIITKAKIKEGMRVADFGVGANGYFLFELSKVVGDSGLVYAIDIIKEALDNINRIIKLENYKNIKTVWSNLEKNKATKINPMSVDVGLLVNTLHQSTNRIDMLREVVRLIKKNGTLLVVDWVEHSTPMGPKSGYKVNKENLLKGAERLGLLLEDDSVVGDYHYCLIFKKI